MGEFTVTLREEDLYRGFLLNAANRNTRPLLVAVAVLVALLIALLALFPGARLTLACSAGTLMLLGAVSYPVVEELAQEVAGPMAPPETPDRAPAAAMARLPDGAPALVASLAREAGCTPFAVLLTAWLLGLRDVLGEDDLVVGTTVSLRERADLEGIIGPAVSTSTT